VALARLEHETGIGAADVGQQARPSLKRSAGSLPATSIFSSIFMAVLYLVCVRCRGGALSLWAKTKDFNSYTSRVPKNAARPCRCACVASKNGRATLQKRGRQTANKSANKVSQE
jgi:hypothetical protein